MKHLLAVVALVAVGSAVACSPAGPSQAEGPKPDLDKPPKGAASGEAADLEDALELVKAKNFTAAKARALQVYEKNPKHAVANYVLGMVAEEEKQDDKAVAFYKVALTTDPALIGASIYLSAILIKLEKYDEAAEVAKNGLKTAKGASFELHANLGYALAGKKDLATAVKSWANALKLNPDSIDVRFDRAEALAALGQKDEAIKEYKAVASNPKAEPTLVRASAHGLSQLGEHAVCVAVLTPLVDSKPQPDVLTQRAQCKHKAGDLPGARADIDASIKLKPTLNAHGFGAQWAEEAKDKKACTLHWTELGKLGVGNAKAESEAKKGLDRCKKL